MIKQKNVQEIVTSAFLAVCIVDQHLLKAVANERSVTHRLAVYIEREIAASLKDMKFHVDCEYNRSNKKPKRLHDFKRSIASDDTKGVTVYPDIIVHERGTKNNLIVIEAKLDRFSRNCDENSVCSCDLCKLRAYKIELEYKYAFFVVFPTGKNLASFDLTNIGKFIVPID